MEMKSIISLPDRTDLATAFPSAMALRKIVAALMKVKPGLAEIASQHDGSLPLHFAASVGDIPIAQLILSAYPKAAITPNKKGKIPLHYAAREGRTDMVEFFMKEAPETASIISKKDKLPLHFASGDGHVAVVQALLRTFPQGASLASKKGKVGLHFAARWGHIEIAQELLRVAPNTISSLDKERSCPLHDAAREGQLEMMKFLVQIYPKGLQQENIRGENPLFSAIRSGNVELVEFMVKSWPQGGINVLRQVRDDDDVDRWHPDLLEICLRGAVNIWAEDCMPSRREESSIVVSEASAESEGTSACISASVDSTDLNEVLDLTAYPDGTAASPDVKSRSSIELDINIPRSKSPILVHAEKDTSSRKRSHRCEFGISKRPRGSSCVDEDILMSERQNFSEHRKFYQVHAALQCGASATVVKCVLKRYGDAQLQIPDEIGRLPLHVALEVRQNPELVEVILECIWRPNQAACSHRDYMGRLPLHHALMSRADARIIQALLDSNPKSGVEFCNVTDPRFTDKLPLQMAMECDCDVDAIHMLLRRDPSIVTNLNSKQTLS